MPRQSTLAVLWRGRSSPKSSDRGIHPLAKESLFRGGSAGARTRRSHRETCKRWTPGLTPLKPHWVSWECPGSPPTRAIGQPKPGETVVVSSAAGAVGSVVGQLAQLAGARAVGIAGGAAKCAYARDELLFDAIVDHKARGLSKALAAACPDGIDVYFENVGGPIWNAVLPLLNRYARVPVCGLIAHYNGDAPAEPSSVAETMLAILRRSLLIRGFINTEFAPQLYRAFLSEITPLVHSGRIRYREHVVDGLEAAPQAFIGMLEGHNFGKTLVRVS